MIIKRRDSITALDIYSEGTLPTGGILKQYTFCENAMSYKPFDVSNLQSEVDQQFEALKNDSNQDINNINKGMSTLNDDWGPKYISIDGSGLEIVKEEVFSDYLEDVQKQIEKQQEKCNKLISQIISGTESVNRYLEGLESHYQEYLQAKNDLDTANNNLETANNNLSSEQAKENPNHSVISRLSSDIDKYSEQVSKYSELVSKYELAKIPEPVGQWVIG